jgi:hypothetical protein
MPDIGTAVAVNDSGHNRLVRFIGSAEAKELL